MIRITIAFSLLLLIVFSLTWCRNPEKKQEQENGSEPGFATPHSISQSPEIIPLSPEKSMNTFRLPEGYHLELVASEPMISEPTAIAWDGNGRMYVAQMETYMQTVDAKDQYKAGSRIMLLEDTNDDGKMDRSTVFLDSLVAPRMLLCAGKELLVNETNTYNIYAYSDTNNDGKADTKRSVYETAMKSFGNIEHQRSGLDWNLDNYIYVTTDPVRFRYKGGQLIADSLDYGNNGQWGLTHDNYGRLFYSRAAGGVAAIGHQINPAYGQLEFPETKDDSMFRFVWPIIKTPDVNGAPAGINADSALIRFTSVCGQSVFRGDRLPVLIRGDYFAAEPVGRIIRRAKLINNNGRISPKNVYEKDEFIASTDMNFRPVNTYTGPDGCLYIVDMYRGIIQESTWAQPGSFLYDQIKTKNLDKNTSRGRIYRVVHKDFKRGPQPKMLGEPSANLVKYLLHPNGWWRDNAQKEIIIRNDKAVIPELKKLVSGDLAAGSEELTVLVKIHALWTLEGLGAIDEDLLVKALEHNSPDIRKHAVWISERFLSNQNKRLKAKLLSMKEDAGYAVREQLVLSFNSSGDEGLRAVTEQILSGASDTTMFSALQQTFIKNRETKKYGSKLVALKEADRKRVIAGAAIFSSLCASCHGPEGQGVPAQIAPPLVSRFKLIEKKEEVIKILLHGLSGPVDGKNYPDNMAPMKANDDEWISSVLSFVRFDLCMRSFPKMPENYLNWVMVRPEDVEKVRKKYENRSKPWTWEEMKKEKEKK